MTPGVFRGNDAGFLRQLVERIGGRQARGRDLGVEGDDLHVDLVVGDFLRKDPHHVGDPVDEAGDLVVGLFAHVGDVRQLADFLAKQLCHVAIVKRRPTGGFHGRELGHQPAADRKNGLQSRRDVVHRLFNPGAGGAKVRQLRTCGPVHKGAIDRRLGLAGRAVPVEVSADVVETARNLLKLLADDVLMLEGCQGAQRRGANPREQLGNAAALFDAWLEQDLQGFQFALDPLNASVGAAEEILFKVLEVVALGLGLDDDGLDSGKCRLGVVSDLLADLTDRSRDVEEHPLVFRRHP